MLYSKDDILTAVREELAEANKTLGIAHGFTDNDYKYLGVIAAAWERLLIRLPNGSKPPVSGSLPPHYHILLGQEARKYVTNIGEPINGLTELAFYNGGVFVISEWLGGK